MHCVHSVGVQCILGRLTNGRSICALQYQGGNGSSPVRGVPPAIRSPQNSHSAPSSVSLGTSQLPEMLLEPEKSKIENKLYSWGQSSFFQQGKKSN